MHLAQGFGGCGINRHFLILLPGYRIPQPFRVNVANEHFRAVGGKGARDFPSNAGCSGRYQYTLIIHKWFSYPFYLVAWVCASTNQSHLSMPRETSVNRSAVSASSSSSARSMVLRASRPKVDSARATASTWAAPSAMSNGYSARRERCAAARTVPSAMPPNCTTRSEIKSTYEATASYVDLISERVE